MLAFTFLVSVDSIYNHFRFFFSLILPHIEKEEGLRHDLYHLSLPLHHLQSSLNIKMLVQNCWLLSLLFIVSTTALLSTSSSHHLTSITKTTVASISSTHHSSTSNIKRSTVKTSSTHRPSSSSTKSSTGTPTSTPSIFYLVAADTGQTEFDGSYFKLIPYPDPTITLSGDDVLQFGNKNSDGAANSTLNADGTLQCNSGSGPLYACVSNGHPYTQSLEFEDPADLMSGDWSR